METSTNVVHHEPWNKGKIVGQKAPFKVKDIWALRVPVQYRTGEALLLLSVWHLYLSLPALRAEPIRCERGVHCWPEPI